MIEELKPVHVIHENDARHLMAKGASKILGFSGRQVHQLVQPLW